MLTPYIETGVWTSTRPQQTDGRRLRFQADDWIGDRFKVSRAIEGGMGEVYLCYDKATRQPVAVKTFHSKHLNEPRIHARLREEVGRWIALGKHPHIVHCYGLDVIDELPFIVMEWVVGEQGCGTTLRNRLETGQLAVSDAVQFAIDICRGLQYAAHHQPGLLHRDIKPENILITSARVAKLTDFGLATIAQSTGLANVFLSSIDLEMMDWKARQLGKGDLYGPTGVAFVPAAAMGIEESVGTPGYRSPEQSKGEVLDSRSDVYAVGVVLFEMLAGHTPSHFAGTEILSDQQLADAVKELPVDLPVSLRRLLANCLVADKSWRMSNIDALLDDLSEWFETEVLEPPRTVEVAAQLTSVEHASRAIAFCHTGFPDRALEECLRALDLEPWNYSYHSVCGVIYDRLKRYDDAIAEFNKSLDLAQSRMSIYVNRAFTYENMGRYDDALADCDRAVELEPQNSAIYLNRAKIHASLRHEEEALSDLNEAIRLAPFFTKAYSSRGSHFFRLGRFDEAFADYQRAIDLNAHEPGARVGRGNVYAQRKVFEKALADYFQAIEVDPNYAIAHRNIGKILLDRGELRRAMTFIERAAELGDPEAIRFAPAGFDSLAKQCRVEKDIEGAIACYSKAIHYGPTFSSSYFNRAFLNWELGRREEAIAGYSEGIAIDPSNVRAYQERAMISKDLGRLEEAVADMNRAIALDPKGTSSYLGRGNVYIKMGRDADAVADYRFALKNDPHLATAHKNIGAVFGKNERWTDALCEFEQAAELGDIDAAQRARRIRHDLGQPLAEGQPFYLAEKALFRCVSASTPDELEQAVKEYPCLLSVGFLNSMEECLGEFEEGTQEAIQQRLRTLNQLKEWDCQSS